MADVLLGRTDGIEGFERHVVLKRIRPEHARDQRFIRMFLDEARVAAGLHHQHIVQVYDIGESEGEYFIAMEYIHGEDVRTILSNASKTRAHVPLGYAVAIVSAAAAGLHYAHERRGPDKRPLGIVHRDISPSNILVGYDGSIKILDFGIAKASMRQETRWGTLKGKVSYMSPEQCKGAEVDRRSDVYSLGVVLYELATTTRLFKGESDYLVMDQIVNGRVTLPQVRRPDLPNELSAIIMRAITPDPERRYFTADEFRTALDQWANKSGLTSSTSAIGAYLRKQFGERPEPWLELEGQGFDSFDEVEVSVGGSAPNSWNELQRSYDGVRRSTGSIPRLTGPIVVGNQAAEAAPGDSGARAQTIAPVPSRPTDSKMGWESQAAPPSGRLLTPARIAAFAAPLILILGFAIWKFSGSSSEATAEDTPAAAIAVPPPAPIVTPVPDPPKPAVAVAMETAPPPPAEPEPEATPARKARPAAAPSAPARKPTKVADEVKVIAPANTKPELPAPAPAAPPSPPPPSPSAPALPMVASPGPTTPTAGTPAALSLLAPQAPLAAPPQTVTPTALDANRVAGDKDIMPDTLTQAEIARSGTDKVIATYKLCLGADGNINNVTQLKSTGFPNYDSKIMATIRSQWRYRPFMVNGKAVAVCTAVRFIYSQK